MRKANTYLTIMILSILLGYFSPKVEGLIVLSVVILGIFWGISFIVAVFEEEI